MICIKGRFIGLELKDDGEEPTPLQKFKLKKIKKAGGISIVATPKTWDSIYLYLKKLASS